MANNPTDKNSDQNTEYDPKLEAQVDAIMNDEQNQPLDEKNGADVLPAESTSAPLLPGEILPNFDEKAEKPKKIEVQDSTEKKPVLEGLVNNVPKKPSETTEDKLDDELSDQKTSKAVDDIVSSESDRILAIEDAKAEMLSEGTAEIDDGSPIGKFFRAIFSFFGSKKFRIIFFLFLLAGLSAAFVYPDSRYFILNKAGVRASTSLKVIDEQTSQPLKNAEVSIGEISGKTDEDGNISLSQIRLGEQDVVVKKPAFADYSNPVTFGWGSNPLDEIGLIATGTKYSITASDYLSGSPLSSAAATSGEADAKADKDGNIILVVADSEKEKVDIEIAADGYRTEKLSLKVGDESAKKVILVPSKQHAFVSKRDGKYDLYKSYIDGKNEEKIFEGTGNERGDSLSLLANPQRNIVAFVSTRSDSRTKNGDPISSLNIINLEDNSVQKVTDSESIQLIDFIGNKVIYVKTKLNSKDEDKSRNQLISYDLDSSSEKELASTNFFNDVLSTKGNIFYSPAEYKVNGAVGLYKISPDGGGKTTILAKEAYNLFRGDYDKINVAVGNEWYQYDTDTTQLNKLNGAPASQKSRLYTQSPDGKKAVWVDERDGKGVLIVYDIESGEEKVIQQQSGLSNPVVWLNQNDLVYRVSNNSETADYAVSINGGEPKKILDVTNTVSRDRFYYY